MRPPQRDPVIIKRLLDIGVQAAIAAVDGVDAVFVGKSDLAASMGHIGDPQHPDVQRVVNDAIAAICATGSAAGVFAATVEGARTYAVAGATMIAVGTDIALFAKSTAQLAAQLHHS